MGTTTTSGTLFRPNLVTEMFDKVKGHSTLAKLSGGEPIPFAGVEMFAFSMDGEAAIVGEGGNKPAGQADFGTVTIKPIKFVYQHRLTDEFVKMSEEKQLPYLNAFSDGFAKKMARALDIAAIHGVNPFDGTASAIVGDNCFDKKITAKITFDTNAPDDNIDSAVKPIQESDGIVTGIAMSPAFGSALGAMKTKDSNLPIYPEYRFGANPGNFGGMAADINNTVSFGESTDRAIVGDFAGAFRWGYAENVTFKTIEYGDPDGLGDLQRKNQIVLRAECFIGWGILDKDSFALIEAAAEEAPPAKDEEDEGDDNSQG